MGNNKSSGAMSAVNNNLLECRKDFQARLYRFDIDEPQLIDDDSGSEYPNRGDSIANHGELFKEASLPTKPQFQSAALCPRTRIFSCPFYSTSTSFLCRAVASDAQIPKHCRIHRLVRDSEDYTPLKNTGLDSLRLISEPRLPC